MAQNLENIQNQINAKMHWSTTEEEIERWLKDKYRIEGDQSKSMILKGVNNRKTEIRKTSLIQMTVALLVAIPFIVYVIIGIQYEGSLGGSGAGLGSVCLICLGYAGKNLLQVISGNSSTSIDA